MSTVLLVLAGWTILSVATALVLGPWLKSVSTEYEEESNMSVDTDPRVAAIRSLCRHENYVQACPDCWVRALAAAEHLRSGVQAFADRHRP